MFVIIHCNWCVRFLIFEGVLSVEVFHKDVWGNSITICKENQLKGIFVGYDVMFEDFPYGEWPCGYRVENVSIKEMFKVFSFGYTFLFC